MACPSVPGHSGNPFRHDGLSQALNVKLPFGKLRHMTLSCRRDETRRRSRQELRAMTLLLIAGTGVILAGLAAIGFGIPVKEFSFGNPLILTGTIGACTGLIMVSLGVVLREMRRLADQLSFAS